ncbi:hypothetical protein GCM10008955_03040 [Deinococcus malanensis]|uniref:DUF937 domain-containing protein n=1 Tax=Deinococcus malanensis TaxID=1706855 RepID=A0ABQ2EIE6_9DEIO|nr:DUF937 domain-containing protein [Deinococcus malanensis]GGK13133.1 hypothetical protein GCM10008955_03040 [Deinococcus malanensis]
MMDIFNMLGGMGQAQQTVGRQLGTSPHQTEAAMEAAVPLLLGALNRNAQTPDGAAALSGALDRHDGRALDLFGQGQVPDPQEGQKILGHLFGNQQYAAANAVSQRSGIDPQMAMQVLMMLAPLVMNYLGRQRQGQSGGWPQDGNAGMGGGGFDIGSILGGMLGGGMGSGMGGRQYQQRSQVPDYQSGGVLGGGPVIPGLPSQDRPVSYQQGQPRMGGQADMGGMIGTLNNVLDRDGDGNALDDLIGMFGGRRR